MRVTSNGLARLTGYSCMAIGAYHGLLGMRSVPGIGTDSATVDSRERFCAAVFAGYGWAWLKAARTGDERAIGELNATMAAGGALRLLSIADRGRPHWFQDVLTAVELGLPVVVWQAGRRRAGAVA